MSKMRYTDEHIDWLREHRPGLNDIALAAAFTRQFGIGVNHRTLGKLCRYHGIRYQTATRMMKRPTRPKRQKPELTPHTPQPEDRGWAIPAHPLREVQKCQLARQLDHLIYQAMMTV